MIAMNFVIVKYQMKYVKYTNPDEKTVMIRRLIILLLIVGCGIFEPEGICVLINTETNTNNCYPQRPEDQCKSDAKMSETIHLRYWGES